MNHVLSPEQILLFAQQANSLMERHDALPAPENFELWYWYASQQNEALVAALNLAVQEGRVSSLEHAQALHARFFGGSVNEQFEEIGHQLSSELNKLT
jgi:hypothetical protein